MPVFVDAAHAAVAAVAADSLEYTLEVVVFLGCLLMLKGSCVKAVLIRWSP